MYTYIFVLLHTRLNEWLWVSLCMYVYYFIFFATMYKLLCIKCFFFSSFLWKKKNCALSRVARAFTLYDRSYMCECVSTYTHTHTYLSSRIRITHTHTYISFDKTLIQLCAMAEGEPNSGNLSNMLLNSSVECDSWVRRRLLIGKRLNKKKRIIYFIALANLLRFFFSVVDKNTKLAHRTHSHTQTDICVYHLIYVWI